jgi:IS5 family transposase
LIAQHDGSHAPAPDDDPASGLGPITVALNVRIPRPYVQHTSGIHADKRGIVHSLVTTNASQADISQMHKLLHGDETEVFGDQAYWSEAHRQAALARGIRYRVNRRGTESRPLTDYQRYINQVRSKARARGEHAFGVIKHLWGFTKVRYRGLAKNTARLFTAFALANLYLLRRRLMPPQGTCRC